MATPRDPIRRIITVLLLLPPYCLGEPSAAASVTPIRHWEPSWVASSAQGTSLAVSCQLYLDHADDESERETPLQKHDNCVLLLMRSAAPSTVSSGLQWKPKSGADWKELLFAAKSQEATTSSLRILEIPMDAFFATSSSQARSSWSPFGSGAICAMTGLASDVDHVSRVVQQGIHTHRIIYDSMAFPSPVSQLVTSLAGTVRDAAKFKGGRPYGLQALLVGSQCNINMPANGNNNRRQMYVYTVDPSGAFRSWGSGCTAIGRNAEDVRQNVYEELEKLPRETPLNPRSALELAFKSLLQATRAANINQDSDVYEAVVFWVDRATGLCRVAKVNPTDVKDCREDIWGELEKAK